MSDEELKLGYNPFTIDDLLPILYILRVKTSHFIICYCQMSWTYLNIGSFNWHVVKQDAVE